MKSDSMMFRSKQLRAGRVSAAHQVYLLTTTTQNRRPHFSNFDTARIAAAHIHDDRTWADARLLAWVLMPDHWHGLLELGASVSLGAHMQRFKGGVSLLCRRQNQSVGALWQPGFHDHALRRNEDVLVAARYIVNNPVRAGIARQVGEYPYWDAVWL